MMRSRKPLMRRKLHRIFRVRCVLVRPQTLGKDTRERITYSGISTFEDLKSQVLTSLCPATANKLCSGENTVILCKIGRLKDAVERNIIKSSPGNPRRYLETHSMC